MAGMNVTEWLETWCGNHLSAAVHADAKSAMQEAAKLCASEAESAGISIAQLKDASGGDLEVYLLNRQNETSSTRVVP